jgi:hypothetical protein
MLAQMTQLLQQSHTSGEVPPIMFDTGMGISQIMGSHGAAASYESGVHKSSSHSRLTAFGSAMSAVVPEPSEPDSPGSVRTVIYNPHGRSNLGAGQGKDSRAAAAQEDEMEGERSLGLRALSSRALNVTIKVGQWFGSAVGRGSMRERGSAAEAAAESSHRQGMGLFVALLVLLLQLVLLVLLGAWWFSNGAARQQPQRGGVVPQEAAGMPVQASYWLQHMQHLQQEMSLLQSRMDLVAREMQAAMTQLAALSQQQPGSVAAAAVPADTPVL